MRNVRNILIASLAIVIGGIGATAANADTSVYNKYTNTHIYNGYTETNVDAHVASESKTITESNSLKVEAIADLGDVNVANVSVTGSIDGDVKFKADAHSSNRQPVDPVATVYVTEVNQVDITTTSEIADITTFSSNKFSGTEYTHEVGNRFN